MKVVLQRILRAEVTVNGEQKRAVGKGLLLLLGVNGADTEKSAELLAKKCAELRIFEDADGKMNLSAQELQLQCMVVSNFTLYADSKKGRRPSFTNAAPPQVAIPLYEHFVAELQKLMAGNVVTGDFGADMRIELVNDGPVTIILDTEELAKS